MNKYNNLVKSHSNILLIYEGQIPKIIVGIIKEINKTCSLEVTSLVNLIKGILTPPVNLLVNFIWYDADNKTEIAANEPKIGAREIAPVKLNNSPIKLMDKGAPILQKLKNIK